MTVSWCPTLVPQGYYSCKNSQMSSKKNVFCVIHFLFLVSQGCYSHSSIFVCGSFLVILTKDCQGAPYYKFLDLVAVFKTT